MEQSLHVLLYEPDEERATNLIKCLRKNHISVNRVLHSKDIYSAFAKTYYNVCVVGLASHREKRLLDVAGKIKRLKYNCTVIYTGKVKDPELPIRAFRHRVDDFVRVPYAPAEMYLRIRNIWQRVVRANGCDKNDLTVIYQIGGFLFNTLTRNITHGDKKWKLTTKDSELLIYLCERPDKMCKRSEVLKAIWRDDNYFCARSMDVYVARLRKLLHQDPDVFLSNEHGVGFMLSVRK